jgi:hypothetical protein
MRMVYSQKVRPVLLNRIRIFPLLPRLAVALLHRNNQETQRYTHGGRSECSERGRFSGLLRDRVALVVVDFVRHCAFDTSAKMLFESRD